jgi:ribose 5-phosphate isomerase B
MSKPTIAIACDHAGFGLKTHLRKTLEGFADSVIDLGTNSTDSVDYSDYANALAKVIASGKANMGVLICGSGIGISIAANRHKFIRAALCHNKETAMLARQHNDANVLCLGARVTDEKAAIECVKAFFSTEFEGGRHARRVEKLG